MSSTFNNINGSTLKLQDLCRMCASPCQKCVQIFGPEGIANELAIKFCSYLPVKVSHDDTLPAQLCYDCTNLLIQWDAAVLVAIASDKKLKALQWREQQTPLSEKIEEKIETPEPTKKNKFSGIASTESLSCSVCNKSKMEFRELVHHLKTHEMPMDQLEVSQPDCEKQIRRSKRKTKSKGLTREALEDSGSEVNQTTRQTPQQSYKSPSTSGMKRKLRSDRQATAGREKESQNLMHDDIKERPRTKRRKGQLRQYERTSKKTEGGSGDPVVTSSTSSKVSESLDGEGVAHSLSPSVSPGDSTTLATDKKSQQDNSISKDNSSPDPTFKPKVRIISAETINQSLEERAKANARNLEASPNGTQSTAVGSPTSGSVLKPLLPKPMKPNRIFISGGLKSVNSKPGPKLLKLPDGRIIRLLQSTSKVTSVGSKSIVHPAAVQQALPKAVFSQLVANHISERKGQNSTQTSSPNSEFSVQTDNKRICDAEKTEEPDLRQRVTLSNSRIITFNLQPGPKHSANRYTCVFCGKRNLLQEGLHQHAQAHCPQKAAEEKDKTLLPSKVATALSKEAPSDLSD